MDTQHAHSMPTPPFTPQNTRMPRYVEDDALKSTGNVLESLVAYYQQEKMWVYRTRATLEDAFSPPPPPMDLAFQQQQEQQIQRAYSMGATRNYGLPTPTMSDPQAPFQRLNESMPPYEQDDGAISPSRWRARKKGFKLRLDGIRSKRVINTQGSDQLQPREQILEMYEGMMESRMQSCQRMNKLIQDANRARLHHR